MRNPVPGIASSSTLIPSLATAWRSVAVVVCMAAAAHAQAPSSEDLEFFERRVRPLLATHCSECHGPSKQKAGLRVDHIEHLLRGGETGPALVAGQPAASRMLHAVAYDDVELQMPPRGKLDDAEIEVLRDWIVRGAPWPKEPLPKAGNAEAPSFDLEARRSAHWCWSDLDAAVPPVVSDENWARDSLDLYVQAARESRALSHSAEASAAEWLRRASYDLIGLPPSIEELAALGEQPTEEERAAAVDRLLNSERFGERWARHWLDLMRYAETYGHEYDYPIPEAWRYRDYVIRALNADLPYDQFVTEHIAGDLLPEPRLHPEEGTDESILATAFWFFPQATHGPVDVRGDEADRIDNAIDVFSKSFLGLTVACARCHDHKFDAISAEDYYALAGILQSTRRQIAYLDPHQQLRAAALAAEVRAEAATQTLQRGLAQAALPPLAREVDAVLSFYSKLPTPDRHTEFEALKRVGKARGRVETQDMGGFGSHWSDDRQLFWTGGAVGDRVTFEFEVGQEGTVELALHLTRASDYGIVRVLVDDVVALEALDLYSKQVEATGAVALPALEMAAGKHRLQFEITGAHPDAAKRYFVGFDRLIQKMSGSEASTSEHALIEAAAMERELDVERLERWTALLRSELGAVEGSVWALLRSVAEGRDAADRSQRWSIAREEANAAEQKFLVARNQTERLASFDQDLDGWFETGVAFGSSPQRTGAWDPRRGATGIAAGGCADSGRSMPKLQGALRSPTFEIKEPRLYWKLAGRQAQIRVIIDSYVMDTYNELIFGGLSFDVETKGESIWRTQSGDLSRFIGHRAHLEILDDGDGWVAVEEVRAGNIELPSRAAASTRAWLARHEGIGAAFEACVEEAVAALRAHQLDEAGREWLNLVLQQDLLALPSQQQKELLEIHAQWSAADRALPRATHALAATDGTGEDEYVFVRGSWRNEGPIVPRRFLEALGGKDAERIEVGSGRLALAEQLLAPTNPLPARVMVNRVWHHLLGRGLVPTTDDFGVLGERPSHPELLDHLALWFRSDAQWSLKRLLKRVVLSSTYRLSSTLCDAQTEEQDPNNVWLHRSNVRRLQGEALRDGMLCVAGRLDPQMYGPPIALHLTPFLEGRGRPGSSGPVDGEGRRTIYQAVRRNFLPPFQMAFDMPVPFTTVGRRSVSNVPAQALALMNDPFVRAMADHWADHLLKQTAPDDAARIRSMYLSAFARQPSQVELDSTLGFVQTRRAELDAPHEEREVWADVAHVLFQVKEFQFLK